jgi:adenylosuccinate lyase
MHRHLVAQETRFPLPRAVLGNLVRNRGRTPSKSADAMAELGVIPKESAEAIWERAKDATFDVARIDEIEREVKHDVIAFLTHLAEFVGPEARFVHQGMTSSDVLDTCLAVQLARAATCCSPTSTRAGRAEKTRLRAQDDAVHRPQRTASTPSRPPSA